MKKDDVARTGYVGLRTKKSKKVYSKEELIRMGFRLIEWDGRYGLH